MKTIPIHKLGAKNLNQTNFDIIPLNGTEDRNYDGIEPHRHNFYELVVFTKGGGIHEIDFKEYAIEENSVHFISPSQVHRLKSEMAKGFVFCFSEEFIVRNKEENFMDFYPFYDFNVYSPCISIAPLSFRGIIKNVSLINDAFSADSVLKSEIIRCYLQVILLKIKEYFLSTTTLATNQVAATHPKILEFIKLINTNFTKHYSNFQYSQMLGISPNYLNSICKRETGRTATELVHGRLVLEAKRLLYVTKLTVKEISNHLNFDSDAYFARFFKKQVGQTPLDYRKQVN